MNSPSPEELLALRNSAGLTQTQAAALVYVKLRAYQTWEGGSRAMPAASWELLRIKIALETIVKAPRAKGQIAAWATLRNLLFGRPGSMAASTKAAAGPAAG